MRAGAIQQQQQQQRVQEQQAEQLRDYCERKMDVIYSEVFQRMDELQVRLGKRNKIILEKIERLEKARPNRESFRNLIDPMEIRIVGLPKGLKDAQLKSAVNQVFKACYSDEKRQDYSSQIVSIRSWGHCKIRSSSVESTGVVVVGLANSWIRDTLIKNAFKLKDFDAKSTLGMETIGSVIYLSPVWPEKTYQLLKKARSEMKKFVDAPKPVVRNFIVCMRSPGDTFSLHPVYSEKDVENFVDDHYRAAFDKLKTTAVVPVVPSEDSTVIAAVTSATTSKDEASAAIDNPDNNWCKDFYDNHLASVMVSRIETMYVKLHLKYQKFDRRTIRNLVSARKLEINFSNRDSFAVLEDRCEIKITGLPKGMRSGEIEGALKEIFKACDCSHGLSRVVSKRSWGFNSVNSQESILVLKFDCKAVRDLIVLESTVKLKNLNGKKAFGHRADRRIRIAKILPKISYELLRVAQSEMKELGGPAPFEANTMVCVREPNSTALKAVFSEVDLHNFVKEYKAKFVDNL